eukprot:INCI12769.2.p1 GENE.INCI12769.2~~INCI12769.2.p1  ORF type:complete len:472 (-),score=82.55 INCI12769.2:43-1458(-)
MVLALATWWPATLASSSSSSSSRSGGSVMQQERLRLENAISELSNIIAEHKERGELEDAREATAVLERLNSRLRLSEPGLTTAAVSGDKSQGQGSSPVVAGGDRNLVYEKSGVETENEAGMAHIGLSWSDHVQPAFRVVSSSLAQWAGSGKFNEFAHVVDALRHEAYYAGGLHLNKSEPMNLAVVDGHLWNLAAVEMATSFLVFLVLPVVVTTCLPRCICGLSLMQLHRALSVIVALPLVVSCSTGAAWMFCEQVLEWDHDAPSAKGVFLQALMRIHTGDFSPFLSLATVAQPQFGNSDSDHWYNVDRGAAVQAPYCMALGLLTVTMAATGTSMFQKPKNVRRNRSALRRWHHFTAMLAVVWLFFAALTGQMWALTRWWGVGDPTRYFDFVRLMKQLHVGYFSIPGISKPARTMVWWSILGGGVFGLTLAGSGLILTWRVNVLRCSKSTWCRKLCVQLCGKKKRQLLNKTK